MGLQSQLKTLKANDHQGNAVPSQDISLGSITIEAEREGSSDITGFGTIRGFAVFDRVYVFLRGVHSTSILTHGLRQRIAVFDLGGEEIHRLQIQVGFGGGTCMMVKAV